MEGITRKSEKRETYGERIRGSEERKRARRDTMRRKRRRKRVIGKERIRESVREWGEA
jgi:hypothetical protein